uniref:Uncharacterized protein n=1 Tax=Panagrolaimus superbus TaxID=310955 RepID=A0A914Z8F7_9BILA
MSKRFTFIVGICLIFSILWFLNNVRYFKNLSNSSISNDRNILQSGNKEVTHVLVPHPHVVREISIKQETKATSNNER